MPDATPEEVYFALFNEIGILAQLSRTAFEARLTDGLLLPQFSVLNHLVRVRDGRTPLELARAFQVPKTSMTHSLAMLTARGLVREAANPQDGRSKRIWITPEGRSWRDAAIARLMPDLAALHAVFPADRAAAALPHLAALREVMDALRD
jgi:DNA-binding MarR family transcriptional regulator